MAGPLAAVGTFLSTQGARFMATKVGQFLFGSTLRATASGIGIGMLLPRSNANAQVQQYRQG